MMRSHGTNTPREIYQFGRKGEPVYDAIEKMIRLRYSHFALHLFYVVGREPSPVHVHACARHGFPERQEGVGHE